MGIEMQSDPPCAIIVALGVCSTTLSGPVERKILHRRAPAHVLLPGSSTSHPIGSHGNKADSR